MDGTYETEHEPEAAFVVFECGGVWLAVQAARVEGFHDVAPPIPLPGAPAHVAGLVSLGGEVLPLFELASWLGLGGKDASREDSRARLVVASAGELRVAFSCSRVGGLVRVASDEIRSPDAVQGERLRKYVSAAIVGADGLIAVLDLEGVLETARVRG